MRTLAKLLASLIANFFALWATANWVSGFNLTGGFNAIMVVAVILTVLNLLLKPIIKLFLGPIIILTFGAGLILVNAFILYLLDILSENLTIEGIPALIYSSLIVGLINFIINLATKS